ncbi:MAG TPA: hypothetical protein EYQ50_18630 [Verrucomicrobiales bacterium]|nr:hypothetical protein [Verrucomicrobiales bacterium]
MKNTLLYLSLILLISDLHAQPAAGRGQNRPRRPSHDIHYKLRPDSKLMEGVPKGRYTDPKIIQSQVFPGYQHTYWVYVPVQFSPHAWGWSGAEPAVLPSSTVFLFR